MPKPRTVVQRAFIDWCIAYSKFQIVDNMSVNLISCEVNSYDEVFEKTALRLGTYGFVDDEMVERGRYLFPDPPGEPTGSGFDSAYEDVCTALDDWLRTLVMPLEQISFLPEPEPYPDTDV
ncbi:hypothetical protein [Burkholderia contaminans]|uniref:Uncharacterized protein n=1 Tax=Burkholderia contaminans TaxID=488447 RepID=A0A3N8QRL9_9BURK|nr:hypothetical protein [Burkholderia contaminans]RQT26011.1 hypothetical protein DF037_20185 [Burkholderia contaminans]